MDRTNLNNVADRHPMPAVGLALRRGHGVRLMTCAVAMSACAEAAAPPVNTIPTPLASAPPAPADPAPAPPAPADPGAAPSSPPPGGWPKRPPKARDDLARSDWDFQASTGAACDEAWTDCGEDRVCLQDWPGGFCTGACTEDAHCPGAGATCVLPSPQMPGFCMVSCRDEAECMEGYGCDGHHCWPVPVDVR